MVAIDPSIFRAYDIRGIVPDALNATIALRLGYALAAHLRAHVPTDAAVVVGRDGRLSSPELAEALIRGLLEGGMDVVDIGVVPTPLVYFAAHHRQARGAIMVTGSHNPAEYNGFKMVINGKPFYGEAITALAKTLPDAAPHHTPGSLSHESWSERYITMLASRVPPHDLHIAWDPGHGATAEIVSSLLPLLPGTHRLINGTIDGTFPSHHPDPTVPANLVQLMDTMREHDCDIGFAFDGDGDRLGVVTKEGHILWGDQLMILFAMGLLPHYSNPEIILDVKASEYVIEQLRAMGVVPIICKTGHSHIKHKLANSNALLAGEMSGHIFFKDGYLGFDDALYAAMRVLEVVVQHHLDLDVFHASLPRTYDSGEVKIDCDEHTKFQRIAALQALLRADNIAFDDCDGIRVVTPQGWWLCRASNTQPVLIVRYESNNENQWYALRDTAMGYLARVK